MELQHDLRQLQIDGRYSKEDCAYYEGFSSCDSSFSSGPMTPSPMSSRRPSLVEEDLIYIVETAADGVCFNSPMTTVMKPMTCNGPLMSQSFQPISTVDPSLFGDGLPIPLQYQSQRKLETNAFQSSDDFQWDEAIYRQTAHGLEEVPVNMSHATLLDTGSIPMHTKASFHNSGCRQTPHTPCQDSRTIDPTQTHLEPTYLDTLRGGFRTSTHTTLFEAGSSLFEDSLYSPSAQAVGFPESSSGWSAYSQATLIASETSSVRDSSSVATVIEPITSNGDDGNAKIQRSNNARRASRLGPARSCISHACKSRKLETKSKCKRIVNSNSAFTVRQVIKYEEAHRLPCGFQYPDGKICPARFKRSEHLKRHIKCIHEDGKMFECPDPDCRRNFKGRADNRMQHIKKTHLLDAHGPRNRRWTRENANDWGVVEEWEEAQIVNAENLRDQKPRTTGKRAKRTKAKGKE